mmetsp:Transcript_41922/g.104205  ORF Transcript_41922/g.104205 Transcript_41922/m.104205 type:complete len:272 (+) Transcript_41922:1385-2200(+)
MERHVDQRVHRTRHLGVVRRAQRRRARRVEVRLHAARRVDSRQAARGHARVRHDVAGRRRRRRESGGSRCKALCRALDRVLATPPRQRHIAAVDELADSSGHGALEQPGVHRAVWREGIARHGARNKLGGVRHVHLVPIPGVDLHRRDLQLARALDQLCVPRRVPMERLPILAAVRTAERLAGGKRGGLERGPHIRHVGRRRPVVDDINLVLPPVAGCAMRGSGLTEARATANHGRLEVVVVSHRDRHRNVPGGRPPYLVNLEAHHSHSLA